MQTWRERERESCENCHKISSKGYEKKECVYGGKERFKE